MKDILAAAGLAIVTVGCASETIQLARHSVIEYDAAETYSNVAHGGFDENALFGRFDYPKISICRDQFVDAVTSWQKQQGLELELTANTKLVTTLHVSTRDAIAYFEMTYTADPQAHTVRIASYVIDAKGHAYDDKAYVADYGLHALGTAFRKVLECAK